MKNRQHGFASHLSMMLGGLFLLLLVGFGVLKGALEIAEASLDDAAIWIWLAGAGLAIVCGWGEIAFLRVYPSTWLFAALCLVSVPASFAVGSKPGVVAIVTVQLAICIVFGRLASRALRKRYEGRTLPFGLSNDAVLVADLAAVALSAIGIAALVFFPVMLLTLAIGHLLYVSMAWGAALSAIYGYATPVRRFAGIPVSLPVFAAALVLTLISLWLLGEPLPVDELSSASYGAFLPCLVAFWASRGLQRKQAGVIRSSGATVD